MEYEDEDKAMCPHCGGRDVELLSEGISYFWVCYACLTQESAIMHEVKISN